MLSISQKRWDNAPHFFGPGESSQFVERMVSQRHLSADAFPSPYQLSDMKRAVERIEEAIKEKETICIFGDYDCDGITAAAQLVRFFRRRGVEPLVRLPHRIHDGYGLKTHIVDELIQKKVDLIITVDTGISSEKEIAYARECGIEAIVTDHHHIPECLPPAVAIVHPGLSKGYPEPFPSGAGVAFQLVRALENTRWEEEDIDTALAMIGTVADLVELRGSNRMLVQKGLRDFMNLSHSPLAVLRDEVRSKEFTSRDIAFLIAPRINAAGRMDDPLIALHALLEGGDALKKINDLNINRQIQTAELLERALKEDDGAPFFCLEDADFPPGIIGLIAGKIVQEFGRPALIAHTSNNMCTASLRGVPGYHLMEGLNGCKSMLTTFGGHALAAGCTFEMKHFENIKKFLADHILQTMTQDMLTPALMLDGELLPQDVTLDFAKTIQTLEPFGQGNPEPLFVLNNITLDSLRLVGTDGRHVQGKMGNVKMIGFGLGKSKDLLLDPIDIACKITLNEWQGRVEPQVVIEDVRVSQKIPVTTTL